MAKKKGTNKNNPATQNSTVNQIQTQTEEQNNIMKNEEVLSPAASEEYEKAVKLTREKVTIHELINFDKVPSEPVKVSIVMPVCNVEQYLRECLDSCVNQTLKEIEIICVNDGSADGCLDILKEYAAKDDRVKVIDKDNAGYGHTMNIGMDMARGEYIGIVESDDFVELNMYEELYKVAKENELDIAKADFNRFYGSKGNYKLEYNRVARSDENYNVVINPSENIYCFRFIMNTWSGIYNHNFLLSHGIRHNETPGASFQDNGFWFKTFAEAQRIMFLNDAYYMNRRDNPNSSVYNPQKVYCANDEYKYIHDYICSDENLKKKYMYIFSQKRYHTYLFTLNRIADTFKKEYVHVFAKDFKEADEKGELNQAYFTKKEWETLHWIMRDPDEFYYNSYTKRIKISAVLTVYNTGNYLHECIDSLLGQTFKNFEVICIDDGSTDDSYNILYEYSMKDPRVHIFHQDNKGAGAARNFGLSIAQGEYIIFLDSDDYFDKNMLKEAYTKAILTDSDICIFKSKQHDYATGKITECKFSVKEQFIPKKEVFSLSDMTENPFTSIMGWAWDKLYKKSFVLNNGLQFQEQRTTNDMYFVFASLLRAGKITILNKYLYYQRRNVPTSLSNTRALSWDCFYYALQKVKHELEAMGIYDAYKKHFINYALHSCLWNLTTLPQEQGNLLFRKLRDEWFENLDIRDYGEDFYDNKSNYYNFLDIVNTIDEAPYLSYMINRLKRENEELKNPNRLIRISSTESLTLASLVEKLTWNRKQKSLLEKEVKQASETVNNTEIIDSLTKEEAKLKKQNEQLKKQLNDSNHELNSIRNSLSFKLGRLITWLPRKIRDLFRKNK